MEADNVMLRKGRSKKDSGADLSEMDKMIVLSCNKPLSKEELSAFGPMKKTADVGLKVYPWATVKMIDTEGKGLNPVVFVGVKGTF